MSWKTLTPAAKKRITTDWNAAFPEFGVYKPMHLLRRAGPLLMGIRLEGGANNDFYRPVFHIHNLSQAFPVISLSHPKQVPNEYVHIEWHELKLAKITQQLRAIVYLPISGSLALRDILDGFHAYLHEPFAPYEPDAFQNSALISGWCGNLAEVSTVLNEAENVMTQWPEAVLKQMGGLGQWLTKVRASAEDQEGLRKTTAEQIRRHGVGDIPATEIT